MKFALSALGAMVFLAGSAGCHSCCCPLLHGHDCTQAGCGPRYRFRPYQHCNTCDQCGNWTGAPIVSRSNLYPKNGYAEDYGQIVHDGGPELSQGEYLDTAKGYRVVPGSQRVIRRSGQPTLARASGQPTPAIMADESVDDEMPSAPTRAKPRRVSRTRTMRMED